MKLNYLIIFTIFFINNILIADKADDVKNKLADLNRLSNPPMSYLQRKCKEGNNDACDMLKLGNLIKKFTITDSNTSSVYNSINYSTKFQSDINEDKINLDDTFDQLQKSINYLPLTSHARKPEVIALINALDEKLNEIKKIYKAYCKKNTCVTYDGQKLKQETLICKRI